jgi:hypothetical protein
MQNLSAQPFSSLDEADSLISNDASRRPNWQLFPYFVVRTTGFPYELVERLRSSELLLHTQQLYAAKQQLQELREIAPKLHHPNRKILACFQGGRPLPEVPGEEGQWVHSWNKVARGKVRLESEFPALYAREAERLKALLLDSASDPRVLEAIASTNPGVYRDLTHGKLNKRLERQLATYMQRLSTKNETISFFGPINYGLYQANGSTGVEIEWEKSLSLRARRAHPASWLIRGLIDQIAFSSEVAPWLVFSRRTFASLDSIKKPSLMRLLTLADGATPLYQLVKKADLTLEDAITMTRQACRARFITHQFEVPAACESPLEDLLQRLAGLPVNVSRKHLENVETILTLVTSFSDADAEGKVAVGNQLRHLMASLYGIEGPEAAPQFYGDRQPVREECAGTLHITISGKRASEIEERVQPTLSLLTGTALRTQKAANKAVATILGVRTDSFIHALMACADQAIPFDTQLIDSLAAAIPDPEVHEVDIEKLALPNFGAEPSTGAVCSIDLMIAGQSPEAWSRGDYELILSDVHDTALVWGWAMQFHQRRVQIQAQLIARLARLGGTLPVINALASRRTGLPPAEFPGPVVEVGGLSANAHPWRLPIDDLYMKSNGEEAHLYSRSLDSEVKLWNGELESLFHTAFALPRIRPVGLSLGKHTPRLIYRGAVLQREQWQVEMSDVKNLFEAASPEEKLMQAVEIWERFQLPQRLFMKFPLERKPIYIDLASPHLLATFDARRQVNPYVVFSELRPGPEDLWLQSSAGHHTSELRCTFVHEGSPS